MKINTLLTALGLLIFAENAICQKKKSEFNSKNKVEMGYSVLNPPILVEYDGNMITERHPFKGINMGFERKLFKHFTVNTLAHFVFGEQNGTSYGLYKLTGVEDIQTTKFRQIDIRLKCYVSKKTQGLFLGTGVALLRGNLTSTVKDLRPRKYRELDLILGYSQTIFNKWFVQVQASSPYWGSNVYGDNFDDFIKWNRHTLSLQTGLLF